MKGKSCIIIALAALAAGCAPQQETPAPAPYVPASIVTPAPKHIDVPPDPAAALDPQVRQAYEQGENSVSDGLAMYYAYHPHASYDVYCAPLKVVDIQFNPDESIVPHGVNLGDSARWPLAVSEHMIVVKPNPTAGVAANTQGTVLPSTNFSTNLIVQTTKRTYHFNLHSTAKHAAGEVAFYYPDELQAAELARRAAIQQAAVQAAESTDPPAPKMNFAYRIDGPNVAWKPTACFDDGTRTFIQFPPNTYGSDLPAFEISSNGQPAMVNYETKNNYYIVDRLFHDGLLTAGTGANRTVVRIEAEK